MVNDRGEVCGSIQLDRAKGVMVCLYDSVDSTAVRVRCVAILLNETKVQSYNIILYLSSRKSRLSKGVQIPFVVVVSNAQAFFFLSMTPPPPQFTQLYKWVPGYRQR